GLFRIGKPHDGETINPLEGLDQIVEQKKLDRSSAEEVFRKAQNSMVPFTKQVNVIENRLTRDFNVTRNGVGVLNTQYGKFHLFDFEIDDYWHYYSVFVLANLDKNLQPVFLNPKNVLIRIDSGCETGQMFGDLTCECRDQLLKATSYIQKAGQ